MIFHFISSAALLVILGGYFIVLGASFMICGTCTITSGAYGILLGAHVLIFGAFVFIFGAFVFIFGVYVFIFGAYVFTFGAFVFIFGAFVFIFGALVFKFGAMSLYSVQCLYIRCFSYIQCPCHYIRSFQLYMRCFELVVFTEPRSHEGGGLGTVNLPNLSQILAYLRKKKNLKRICRGKTCQR